MAGLAVAAPGHPRLTFERVTTAAQIEALADVNAVAHDMPAEDFRATLPEAQRQGFGETVTRHALYEAGRATGLRRATLHSTEAGVADRFRPEHPVHAYALTS